MLLLEFLNPEVINVLNQISVLLKLCLDLLLGFDELLTEVVHCPFAFLIALFCQLFDLCLDFERLYTNY